MNLPKINSNPVKLKIQTIEIGKEIKRFTGITALNPIPKDTIIYKTLAGIGATYCEIKSQRNSIIIMPNVATILSKHNNHKHIDNTFAVYEKVKIKDLKEYLASTPGYKKILTTPEGFINKLMPVLGDEMYKNYFLLLDECHKLIKDAGFRKAITEPMECFFKFENKAMISATPIAPSDIRFKEAGFRFVKIDPTYNYRHDIEVIKVYDVAEQALQQILANEHDTFFVFFDSITGIKNIINLLKKSLGEEFVAENYRIFCSRESATDLAKENYHNAYNFFTPGGKINFLTSSFYNGLDIDFDGENVRVLMISDLHHVGHSAIDPDTDGVQILGRFRAYENPATKVMTSWVRSFTHIVRTSTKIIKSSQREIIERITENQKAYYELETIKNTSVLTEIRNVFAEAQLRLAPYANLLNEEMNINPYRLDNYIYEELTNLSYRNKEALAERYLNSNRFNFNDTIIRNETRSFNKYEHGEGRYSVQNYIDVINVLWACEGEPGLVPASERATITRLFNEYELIVRAYFALGVEIIESAYFEHKLVMKIFNYSEGLIGKNKQPILDEILSTFKVNAAYFLPEAKSLLQGIYDDYNVDIHVDAKDLSNYFNVKLVYKLKKDEQGNKSRQKALRILRANYNPLYARS